MVLELKAYSEFLRVFQMANKELSELQSDLETLKEKNKQAEMNLMLEQGLSREKVCFKIMSWK